MFGHKDFPSLGCDIVLPNALNHSHVFPKCSEPSHSLEYYIDVPIYNSMICDVNVDFGYEYNMFDVLGGNVDDLVPQGCLRGYDPSVDSY